MPTSSRAALVRRPPVSDFVRFQSIVALIYRMFAGPNRRLPNVSDAEHRAAQKSSSIRCCLRETPILVMYSHYPKKSRDS
jgi:hypothetical protein